MTMKRREFIEKALLVGGLAALQPWQLLKMVGGRSVEDARRIVEQWDCDAEAGQLPMNNIVWGDKLVDPSVGLAGLVSHGKGGGDATFSASEETGSEFLFPSGKDVSKVFKLQVTAVGTGTSWYNFTFSASYIPNSFGQFIWPVWSTWSSISGLPPKAVVILAQESTFTNTWTYQYSVAMNSLTGGGTERYDGPVMRRTSPNGTAGAPSVSATFTRVQLRIEVPAGIAGTYYLAPLMVRNSITPRVSVGFDDGWAQEYTDAYPYMLARGIPGSCAVIGNLQNGMTISQMQEMRAKGWSFHNHTFSHPDMTTLSESQINDELDLCNNVLRSARLDDSGSQIMIPPFGAGSNAIDLIIKRKFPYVARYTNQGMRGFYGILRSDSPPLTLARYSMDVPTSFSTIRTAINGFIAQGQDVCLYAHKPAIGAPSGELDLGTFKSVMDLLYTYNSAGIIKCVNFNEMVTQLSSPRRNRIS